MAEEKEQPKETLLEKLAGRIFNKKDKTKTIVRIPSRDLQDQLKHGLDYTSYLNYEPFNSYYSSALSSKNWDALANNLNKFIQETRRLADNPFVESAITEIVNEAIIQNDYEPCMNLNIDELEASDKIKEKIMNEWQYILNLINWEDEARDLFKQFYIDGQLNLNIIFDNEKKENGIAAVMILSPYNFFSYTNPETKETYYFYSVDVKPNFTVESGFKDAKEVYQEEEIARAVSGIWSQDRAVPISYLTRCQKVANQLSLLEDSMIIFRITRAPEKRVFYIYTGRLPKTKAEEYVKSLISKYRQKKIYNQDTGLIQNQPTTLSILDDYWFPVGENEKGTKVENLPGQSPDMGQLFDVQYFKKKLLQSLKVPVNRLDDEARLVLGNTVDIEKEEIKFIKFVEGLQRNFSKIFLHLLKVQLIAKKIFNLEEWEKYKHLIKINFAKNNLFEETKHLQTLNQRIEAAQGVVNLLDAGLISKDWLYKEILRLDDDQIKEMQKQIQKDRQNTENLEPVYNAQQANIGPEIGTKMDKGQQEEGDSESEEDVSGDTVGDE